MVVQIVDCTTTESQGRVISNFPYSSTEIAYCSGSIERRSQVARLKYRYAVLDARLVTYIIACHAAMNQIHKRSRLVS